MSEQKKGILMIISGFSGSGKGTIVGMLMKQYADRFRLSISATTRSPRNGEENGVHYFFKSKEEFERMIADGEMLEHACYVGNYYGTPKAYVEQQLEAGHDVILEIEQQGAFQVKEAMPESVLVFLTPPSIDELERRLRGRQTESEDVILARLAQASIEAEHIHLYDYLVINDDQQGCVDSIIHLLDTEKQRTTYNGQLIEELRDGLKSFGA